MTDSSPNNAAPTLWQMIKSVLSAFFGIQKNSVRERDFQHGKFHHFVIIGIIGTVLFIGGLVALVSVVINLTQ